MKKLLIFALALLMATGLSAQECNCKWTPVGNRKIRVVHWGICHGHSKGKWVAVKNLSDDFELLGWVDDTDSKAVRMNETCSESYLPGGAKGVKTNGWFWGPSTGGFQTFIFPSCLSFPVRHSLEGSFSMSCG